MKIAKQIIAVLLIALVVVGIVMVVKNGINTGLLYTDREQIGVMINSQFDVSDVRKIASEVFENEEFIIQKATIFEDTVVIQSKEISDEQKQKLVQKLNEMYNLNVNFEEVEIEMVGAKDLKNDLNKYILPTCLTLVLIVVYCALRFRKLGSLRTIVRFLTTVIFAELIYVSVLSITQVEIGRLLAPLAFMLYMLCVVVCTAIFEKERTEVILSENNK